MKNILKRAIGREEGAVLILALILLVVGGLILTPLLGFMSTGLVAGQVYERKTAELYAADAGVEDAIWRIQSNNLTFDAYDRAYPEPLTVNGKNVTIEIWRYQIGGTTTCDKEYGYQILSTATDTDRGSSTRVEAHIEIMIFDLFGGALVSMSDIDFHKDCVVTGDVYYVGAVDGDYTHIDGDEIQVLLDAFPTQEQNEAFAGQFKAEALGGGTWTGDMTISSNTTLGPRYITGDLSVEDKIKLNLAGTIYVEGSIDFKKDSEVTGSGSIVAVGDIYLSKLPDYGIEGDSIIFSLGGDITFKKEAIIEALVYAPNGNIIIDKEITVLGGVIGANIQVDKDGSFEYIPKSSSFDFPTLVPYGAEIRTYTIT